MKRLFDIVFSLTGIFVLLPFFIIIGISILLSDGYPMFFLQYRVGQNGKLFRLFKYRTMSVRKGTENGSFDAGNSSRVTRIGAVLRKTKLDEVPQLFNVLVGQMSIVGPRPEVEKWTKVYPERWANVLKVRPGITDNASIEFRNEEEILAKAEDPELCYTKEILPKKLALYEQYAKSNTILKDIKIITKTIKVILN